MFNLKKLLANKWLIILVVLFILLFLNKCYESSYEGMENKEKKFIYKNNDIYDKFYASIYDDLLDDEMKVYQEIGILKELTKLNENDYLLDVGSGTGHLVGMLKEEKIKALGVDKSIDMIKVSSNNYPELDFKQGKVQDPFLFPRDKFTHITAFYFTIYYLKDKKQFFENSYSWLKPNGYLVIHLVDKLKFDPILNSADPLTLINPQDYSEKRLTKSVVVFDKFEYFSNFNLEEKGSAYFNEKFKFENGDVRINQHELFMEDRRHILDLAIQCGFTSYKYVDLSDINYNGQYIYILKKNTQ